MVQFRVLQKCLANMIGNAVVIEQTWVSLVTFGRSTDKSPTISGGFFRPEERYSPEELEGLKSAFVWSRGLSFPLVAYQGVPWEGFVDLGAHLQFPSFSSSSR